MTPTPGNPDDAAELRASRQELPSLGNIRKALTLLGITDGVPAHLPTDHRRAQLLYLISAYTHLMGDSAARVAGLDARTQADMHYLVDADVATLVDDPDLLPVLIVSAQIERLVWAHHTLIAVVQVERSPIGEMAMDTLEGVLHLLQAFGMQLADSGVRDEATFRAGLEQMHKALGKFQVTMQRLIDNTGG